MKCNLCLERFEDRRLLNQHVKQTHFLHLSEELNYCTAAGNQSSSNESIEASAQFPKFADNGVLVEFCEQLPTKQPPMTALSSR
jgi:hypothetical protein